MAGLVYHLVFALISASIVYYNFRKPQYCISIFIGNFFHDVFIMAYAPFILQTLNPMKIIGTQLWLHRDTVFNVLWMIFQTIFILMFFLFQRYVKEKRFREFEYNVGFLLIGIITHATIDMMVEETGIWF